MSGSKSQGRLQLVLDVGGVLVSSLSPGFWAAIGRSSGKSGSEVKARFRSEVRERLWSGEMSEAEFWDWLSEAYPGGSEEERRAALREQLQPLPALRAVAAWSRAADIHLLSNHRREWLEELLAPLAGRLASVTISSEAGMCKPDRRLYERVREQLDADRPVLYVDDQARNLESAEALGWRVLLADPDGQWLSEVERQLGRAPGASTPDGVTFEAAGIASVPTGATLAAADVASALIEALVTTDIASAPIGGASRPAETVSAPIEASQPTETVTAPIDVASRPTETVTAPIEASQPTETVFALTDASSVTVVAPSAPTAVSSSVTADLSAIVDTSRCPLCGGDNRCAILRGAEIDSCWCRAAAIPRGLLERVPAERAGQACICAACVAAYHQEVASER